MSLIEQSEQLTELEIPELKIPASAKRAIKISIGPKKVGVDVLVRREGIKLADPVTFFSTCGWLSLVNTDPEYGKGVLLYPWRADRRQNSTNLSPGLNSEVMFFLSGVEPSLVQIEEVFVEGAEAQPPLSVVFEEGKFVRRHGRLVDTMLPSGPELQPGHRYPREDIYHGRHDIVGFSGATVTFFSALEPEYGGRQIQ